MSEGNRIGTFFTGLAVGSAIGTVIGLLIAPRTGKETRKVLEKSTDALPELAEDLASTIQLQTNRLSHEAVQNWEQTLVRLQKAIAAGQEATEWEKSKMRSQQNRSKKQNRLN